MSIRLGSGSERKEWGSKRFSCNFNAATPRPRRIWHNDKADQLKPRAAILGSVKLRNIGDCHTVSRIVRTWNITYQPTYAQFTNHSPRQELQARHCWPFLGLHNLLDDLFLVPANNSCGAETLSLHNAIICEHCRAHASTSNIHYPFAWKFGNCGNPCHVAIWRPRCAGYLCSVGDRIGAISDE
jgi:hypothetical protein